MKTDMNQVAAVVATAVWADGVYQEAEKTTMGEIANALGFDENAFTAAVEKCGETVKDLDDAQLNEYLAKAAAGVDKAEAETVYECALQTVLCDGVLAADEVGNVLAIAEALGLTNQRAVLLLADLVKTEPDLEVEVK